MLCNKPPKTWRHKTPIISDFSSVCRLTGELALLGCLGQGWLCCPWFLVSSWNQQVNLGMTVSWQWQRWQREWAQMCKHFSNLCLYCQPTSHWPKQVTYQAQSQDMEKMSHQHRRILQPYTTQGMDTGRDKELKPLMQSTDPITQPLLIRLRGDSWQKISPQKLWRWPGHAHSLSEPITY